MKWVIEPFIKKLCAQMISCVWFLGVTLVNCGRKIATDFRDQGAGIAQQCIGLAVLPDAVLPVWASSEPLVEGIFPLELTWVLNPLPKTLSAESINQDVVCAHMQSIAQTPKILTFMSQTGECRQPKHTQHASSTKTECDYLYGWITNWSYMQKSHSKCWTPEI